MCVRAAINGFKSLFSFQILYSLSPLVFTMVVVFIYFAQLVFGIV